MQQNENIHNAIVLLVGIWIWIDTDKVRTFKFGHVYV